jgi:hypothetical protein
MMGMNGAVRESARDTQGIEIALRDCGIVSGSEQITT